MRIMKRLSIIVLALLVVAPAAHAQLGGLFGKSKDDSKSGAKSADPAAALAQGNELLSYVTTANDLGVSAVSKLLDMYPPEKVANIQMLAAKYNDMTVKRKDGNIDSEQLKTATELTAEMAKLQASDDWKNYKKEKASTVSAAYAKLGLMVLADGIAGSKVKPTVDALQVALNDVTKNPLGAAGKVDQIKSQIAVLTEAGKSLPKQVESGNSVRKICSQIASAEKVKLPAETKPEQIADKKSLETSAKEIN